MACIDFHQTASVGDGSDPLQLIKFWPSCAAGKGVCSGAKTFGSALLQPARNVCVSPSAFFISLVFVCLFLSGLQKKLRNRLSHNSVERATKETLSFWWWLYTVGRGRMMLHETGFVEGPSHSPRHWVCFRRRLSNSDYFARLTALT